MPALNRSVLKTKQDDRHRIDLSTEVAFRCPNSGEVVIYNAIDRETDDFQRILVCAKFFANQGKTVVMTPKLNVPYKNPAYDMIYGSLKGTPYYGKCPDLCVDGNWYEHEGFTTINPKTNFSNMCTRGLRQSDRIIIEDPDLSDGYMKRNVLVRIAGGQKIKEIWVKKDDELRVLYKAE